MIPGQRWSFQHDVEKVDEVEATLDNQELTIENKRASDSTEDQTPFIAPATSVQEFGVQTSSTSDESSELILMKNLMTKKTLQSIMKPLKTPILLFRKLIMKCQLAFTT